MNTTNQILIGISIGIFILLLQGANVMVQDYLGSEVIYVEEMKFHGLSPMDRNENFYIDNNWTCYKIIEHHIRGSYSYGGTNCYTNDAKAHIYWNFEYNQQMVDIDYGDFTERQDK